MSNASAHVTVLEPVGRRPRLELAELWRYRDLVYVLAWRDVKVRYKQAVFGLLWAILQPLLLMGLMTLIFTRIGSIKTGFTGPYPVFVFAALVPWTVFSTTITASALSVTSNANLVSKVYFPRLAIPLGSVLARIPDFLMSIVVLFVIFGIYGYTPPLTVLLLPLVLVATLLGTLSLSIWFSALSVAYRDIQYVVPLLVQAWLFITPIAYPASLVPHKARIITTLNPMTWVVNVSRWSLVGGSMPLWMTVGSAATMCVVLVGGTYYFRSVQHFFADVI